VLSGRGLFDQLITRPEESYRIWCVVVGKNEVAMVRFGLSDSGEKLPSDAKIHEFSLNFNKNLP